MNRSHGFERSSVDAVEEDARGTRHRGCRGSIAQSEAAVDDRDAGKQRSIREKEPEGGLPGRDDDVELAARVLLTEIVAEQRRLFLFRKSIDLQVLRVVLRPALRDCQRPA
jgi:hypothetical protein